MGDPRQSFYVRLAAGGFLLTPAANFVLGAILLAIGQTAPRSLVVTLTALSAVNLAAGAAIWLTGRLLVPGLAVAAFLVSAVLYVNGLFGITHPESFFDFTTAVVILVGPVVAGVGCAVAIVQRRRGTLRPARRSERAAVRVGVAALLLSAGVSAFLTYVPASAGHTPDGALIVQTRVDRFDPSVIEVARGELVRIMVDNRDSYAHTFTVDDLAVDQYVGPRSRHLVTFRAPTERATLHLQCYVVGHEAMTGTIVVR